MNERLALMSQAAVDTWQIWAAVLGIAVLISWLSSRAIDHLQHAGDERDGRALVERGERARRGVQ